MVRSFTEITEPIGVYFELELRKGEHYHKDAIRLNTACNCFEYILLDRHYKITLLYLRSHVATLAKA